MQAAQNVQRAGANSFGFESRAKRRSLPPKTLTSSAGHSEKCGWGGVQQVRTTTSNHKRQKMAQMPAPKPDRVEAPKDLRRFSPNQQKKRGRQRKPRAPEDGQCFSFAPSRPAARPAHAQPPAAGGQPLPAFLQHQAFFEIDQPLIQFANPASQSYGADVVAPVAQPPAWVGQPLPWTLQHHDFFATDQPACQFANPSSQLYGSAGRGGKVIGGGGEVTGVGQPRWWILQHHVVLSAFQVFSAPTAQLNGSTGPEGLAGGAAVGNGVGGTVGVVSGRAVRGRVVAHPLPIVVQQKSCCACVHAVSHTGKPDSQS